jgi:hypothetical protein
MHTEKHYRRSITINQARVVCRADNRGDFLEAVHNVFGPALLTWDGEARRAINIDIEIHNQPSEVRAMSRKTAMCRRLFHFLSESQTNHRHNRF